MFVYDIIVIFTLSRRWKKENFLYFKNQMYEIFVGQ